MGRPQEHRLTRHDAGSPTRKGRLPRDAAQAAQQARRGLARLLKGQGDDQLVRHAERARQARLYHCRAV